MGSFDVELDEDIYDGKNGHAEIHVDAADQVNFLTEQLRALRDGDPENELVAGVSASIEEVVPTLAAPIMSPSAVTGLTKVYRPAVQAYNVTGSSMGFWRAALARQRNEGARAKAFCAGDSTTLGIGLTGASTNYYIKSYPPRLLTLLQSKWGTVRRGPSWANGTNDTARVTLGTGWSTTSTRAGNAPSAANGLGGGGMWRQGSSPVGTLDFAPGYTCDTFEIYYLSGSGNGSFSWAIDGGSTTTINAATGSQTVSVATVTTTSGTHTLNLKEVSGAANIIGVGARLSTDLGGIELTWQGVSSTTTDYWGNGSVNAFGSQNALAAYDPDLLILGLGLNDSHSVLAGSPSVYKTNLEYIVDQQRANLGDVLLVLPWKSDAVNQLDFTPFRQAAYEVADDKDVALLDLGDRWPSVPATAVAEPYALMNSDHIHGTERGYWDMAQAVADVLTGAA